MIVNINHSDCVVIIVNFNGSLDTLSCLKSIDRSTIDTAVIVVDNCSDLKDYTKLKNNCERAIIIRSNVNLGFAGGNNLGICTALQYDSISKIVLLNNDTEVKPDCFELLFNNLKEGIITTPKMLYYFNKNKIWYAGGHINKITGRAIHDHMNKYDNINLIKPVDCDFTSGCCMAFMANDIKRIGFLKESYFMYCEDTEFCLRAIKKGIKIRYVPQSVIYHKVSQSTGGGESEFCLYYMTRNRLKYLKEYRSYFSFFAIPFTLASRYVRIIQYILKKDKRWKAINKGIHDFYSHIEGRSYY